MSAKVMRVLRLFNTHYKLFFIYSFITLLIKELMALMHKGFSITQT